MGKKARFNFVRKLKTQEIECMKGLWRTGVMTREQLEKKFDIKGQRLINLKNSKYLKIDEDKVYLGDRGETEMETRGMEFRYKSDLTTFEHDYQLSDFYLSLSEETRETWMTEKELLHHAEQSSRFFGFRTKIKEKYGKYQATPDGAFVSDGKLIGIDIITESYSNDDALQKEEFGMEFLHKTETIGR